jgi:3-(3-hydroxy-phenyl)propionate hydroxylase
MPANPAANSELPSSCDVAIIGAGPIGLMLANLLGTAGVDVVIIERNNGLVGLPRAIAYDAETLRLFAQVGLFDAIATGLIQGPEIVYFNARGKRLMDMNPPRSPFGHSPVGTFYQPHFERALLGGLERFASAQVLFGHTVTALAQDHNGVDIRIETPRGQRALHAQFVVGCDGGASMTRDAIGARLVGATYAERWLVVDALIDNHDVDKITFFCDPRRPTVQLPAVGSRVRFEFMQLPGENPDELASDHRIKEFLEPYIDFARVKIERRVVYTFHARVADAWRKGRVLLAGDAAHLMPPFAGQGMNGGMKDCANLAWKLAAVTAGKADADILDTYEVERARSVRTMVSLSRRLGAVIMPTNRALAALRDTVFAVLNLSNGFRAFVRRGGVLPPPRISKSALTGVGRDAVIGQMLPQPDVSLGGETRALDSFLSCHQWLVLGVGADPSGALSARDRAILDGLGATFVAVNAPSADRSVLRLQCREQSFLDWATRHRLGGVLVRPDRFIAERLASHSDLRSLCPFANTARVGNRARYLRNGRITKEALP